MDSLFDEVVPSQTSISRMIVRQIKALLKKSDHTTSDTEAAFAKIGAQLVSSS